jgi:hypothetical protein
VRAAGRAEAQREPGARSRKRWSSPPPRSGLISRGQTLVGFILGCALDTRSLGNRTASSAVSLDEIPADEVSTSTFASNQIRIRQ